MLNLKRICSVFLIVMLILCSVSMQFVNAQVAEQPDDTEVLYPEGIISTDDEETPDATEDEIAPDATEDEIAPDATDDETEGEAQLPPSVDNSLSPYFPKLSGSDDYLDQKAIDSAVFATVYYQFTYEMNKLRGVESTYENTFSPIFVYHVINKGIQNGSALEDTYNYLKNVGCVTNNYYPYYELRWDNYDYWPGAEKTWRESFRYRMESSQDLADAGSEDSRITSPDDSDLIEIKTAINAGKLITADTYMYGWDNYGSNGNSEVRQVEKYLDRHTVVIVGYDDNFWCDLNCNGICDSGEMGAFKVVNTWTQQHRKGGVNWIAYDALNETSVVEGMNNVINRTSALTSMKTITVKAPDEGKDIYVGFELDYGVRSEFTVNFTAEKNGEKYEKRFLPGVDYLVEGDKHRFSHANFAFSLKDLVPNLNSDNFDEYEFYMTVTDNKDDGYDLRLVSAELVNEFTGTRSVLVENWSDEPRLENSEYTVKIQNNVFIYYIGFDNPIIYLRTDDGNFTEAPMTETLELKGYYYKYFIPDSTDAEFYFADKNKVDDNNGEYYKAGVGFNYYKTEGQRPPLTVVDFGFANGLPDIDTVPREELNRFNYKTSRYYAEVTGGYGPYYYKLVTENLESRDVGETNYYSSIEDLERFWGWSQPGSYKQTLVVMDWSGATATKSITFDVKERHFEITSLTADKEKVFLSDTIEFKSVTNFMNIRYTESFKYVVPKSCFEIKDSNGTVVWREVVECSEYSYWDMTSTSYLTYKPTKAGTYTLTVSATDARGEYAETAISFVVLDKLYGDANSDGVVNIKDATKLQKLVAGMITEDMVNMELADCDGDSKITIKDVTSIQKYIAELDNSAKAGKIIEYIPKTYKVKFDNSLGWDKVYCELITYNPQMFKPWPGDLMTVCSVDELGVTVYEIEVPEWVVGLSFTDTIEETLRIDFDGGDKHYYPIENKGITLHKIAEK